METGLKTIQTTSNLKSNIIKDLSIQICLSGLSFCILNRSDFEVEYLKRIDFKNKLMPEILLEELQTFISNEPLLSQSFDSVLVLFQNELSNFVPDKFFDEENTADYLKFSSKIIKTDFISYDILKDHATVNVFVPYMNINNYLFEVYGEFEYKHASTILLEQILKTEEGSTVDKMYINVEPFHFEMVVTKKGEFQLYNTFEYFTKEDFIYFILFNVEQLKLDPETLTVKLSGKIAKEDVLYQLLFKYIRFVEFNQPSKLYTYKDTLENYSKHHYSLILNSFN